MQLNVVKTYQAVPEEETFQFTVGSLVSYDGRFSYELDFQKESYWSCNKIFLRAVVALYVACTVFAIGSIAVIASSNSSAEPVHMGIVGAVSAAVCVAVACCKVFGKCCCKRFKEAYQ